MSTKGKEQKLHLPSPNERKQKDWWIKNWTNEERSTMTSEALHMTCVPGKYGMDSGTGFHALPFLGFPTEHMAYEYSVYFDKNFEWVKGGKLPGFGIGRADETATGGDWQRHAGSMRVMWRERGQAIGYLYLPTEISSNGRRDGTIHVQSSDFKDAAEGSLGKPAGIDLFFQRRAGLALKRGAWNRIRVEVKLNDPGKRNGFLKLTVNGKTRELDDVLFRDSDDVQINMVLTQVFFGGGSKEWSAKKKETISLKDFIVTRFT